jgi:hypothetical protein
MHKSIKTRARRAILAVLGLAVVSGAAVAADTKPGGPTYEDLVAQAERGDATVDYNALRFSYPDSVSYDPYGMQTRPLFSAAWDAFQAKDCATATASARAMLKINYLSVPMHAVLQDCLQQSGDAAGAAREMAISRGLAKSLLDSGDGKSTATAYIVVTLSEEGLVLSYLGFKEEQQALIREQGRVYDLISGHDGKTGEPRSAYFDVGAIFAGMAKKLDKSAPGGGP